MFTVGTDLVWIPSFQNICAREPEFLTTLFTGQELDYCRDSRHSFRFESLAGRYAVKEAVLKALQVGLYDLDGVDFRDIEVISAGSGAPALKLSGAILGRALELKLAHWSVSLSHSNDYALAYVLGAGEINQ